MSTAMPNSQQSYRLTNPAPFNLIERIRVASEENLYPQALDLFSSVILSGTSDPNPKPALILPHTFVRLVTTLIAHPYYTTQSSQKGPATAAPIKASVLLRRILRLVGPSGSNISAAWRFDKNNRGGRRNKKGQDRERSPTADEHLSGELANEENLFALAEDVWSVVGWSFTCSVVHPKRWQWWKLVLESLLEGLESDWQEKFQFSLEAKEPSVLKESLVVKMLPDTRGSGGYRRVLRAIWANGSGKNKNEWKEIFADELLKKRPRKNKTEGITNFLGDSDSESNHEAKHSKSNGVTKTKGEQDSDVEMVDADEKQETGSSISSNATPEWGGMDSLILRQRFLSLLSQVAGNDCFIDIEELYHEFKDNIKPLPLPSFILFTSTFLDANSHYRSSLNQAILSTLLPGNTLNHGSEVDILTQDVLIKLYLPYAANTTSVTDNAKVAILLDVLMRLLAREGCLEWSPELSEAAETGARARKNKVQLERRGGAEKLKAQEETRQLWNAAEQRLALQLALLKAKAQA